jgi:small subunit ribosomal protein S9
MLGGKLSSSGQPVEGAKQVFYGTGRRKESVARVFLTFGTGKISINGRTVDQYFHNVNWLNRAVEPMKFTETAGSVDIMATVNGGGVGGQSGAFRMGLSRALSLFNPELRAGLRKNGFLTRDSRMKERKKYGQKGARKRFQFSKR